MPSDEDPNYCSIAVNLVTASTDSGGLFVGNDLNNDFQGEPAAVASTERQASHVESTSGNKEATDRCGYRQVTLVWPLKQNCNVASPVASLEYRLTFRASAARIVQSFSCEGRCMSLSFFRQSTREKSMTPILTATVGIAVVAIGITELQSQTTDTPAKSASSADAYLMRGEALSGNQQYDRAIADYTAAIELKPDYAEAYNDRGFAYYLKGDFEQAISDYTRAIELRPNYPKAYNSRGVAYMQGGYGAAKSVPDFDRAIELKPDFRYAYINRANARLLAHPLLALQDFHRAGMHPERALAAVACIFLLFAFAITLVIRRRRIRTLETSGPE
jgi:hypothetical protein